LQDGMERYEMGSYSLSLISFRLSAETLTSKLKHQAGPKKDKHVQLVYQPEPNHQTRVRTTQAQSQITP
jgi:hypothetical protein